MIKREIFLRNEHAALGEALRQWCSGSARVLTKMIALAETTRSRFAAARGRAHPDYSAMIDDWLRRLATEQEFRRLHLRRFERCRDDASEFDDRSAPVNACAVAMLFASRAGILPADVAAERRTLVAAVGAFAAGLRRRLLRQ